MKKAQTPAEGIVLDGDFGGSVFYTVSCECGNTDDEIQFNVEYDDEMQQVTVHTGMKMKSDYFSEVISEYNVINNFFMYPIACFINGFVRRIKLTWNIWVHGYVEYNSWTLMREQTAVNYAVAILKAVKEMKNK